MPFLGFLFLKSCLASRDQLVWEFPQLSPVCLPAAVDEAAAGLAGIHGARGGGQAAARLRPDTSCARRLPPPDPCLVVVPQKLALGSQAH